MTIHDLIDSPGAKTDVSGDSCITSLIDADSIIYIVGWHNRDSDDTEQVTQDVDRFIHDLLVKNQSRQYAAFFSDKTTFRHQIYPAYKANRGETHPGIAKWKPYITEYCIQMWGFDVTDNAEADDAVAALQGRMKNSIVCSPDKDLRQIPGNHFDYKKDQKFFITPEEALYNWATQMICGDTTDNIKGIPGCGPAYAKKVLNGVPAEQLVEVVKLCYYQKFGNYDEFELHRQLIGMGNCAFTYQFHTFDLDNALPSEYISDAESAGQEAEDLFGSW